MRNQPSLITLLLCILCPAIAFAQVDLKKGLAAYYPFNGNANDESGNGNNPIFNNATLAADYFGKANSAYHFNGVDNYMEIQNSSSLNFESAISICAWVRPTGFYYGKCHGNNVIMKGNDDYQIGNYMLRFDDALYTGTNCNGGMPDTIHQTYYGIGTGLSSAQDTPYTQKNIWRSVVYTYDGLHAKLYINCNLILDLEQPGLSFTNGANLFFGKLNNPQFPYWLNGDLDEVRIYNRPLNENEVEAYSFSCSDKSPCSNWAKFSGTDPGVQIGDLDVAGNTITVEALFNRIDNYNPIFLGGDIVSKHADPSDVNYLLRPTRAEITTTTGWHATPNACELELNKTYHVAMVYDGAMLKFYRNGFLMGQTPCSGNMILNDWITRIGSTAAPPDLNPSDFHGYVNEVRIWNVARAQIDIKKYMNQSLPNPASQTGLLAYYTFDDLKNKQGNSQWDGNLLNDASINQINSNCNFIADSCAVICNLNADFHYEQNTCDPKTIQFHANSAVADSIWWNFGNGKTAGNTTDTVVSYSTFGNYVVKLFAKTNMGCLDTTESVVNVNVKKDSAIITTDTTICKSSSIQLNAIAGLQYCWSPSIGLSNTSIQNPIATPTTTTTYYLNILTTNNEPIIQDSITITVLGSPVVNAGKDIFVCKGVPIQLNASGAVKYSWNTSGYLSDTSIANPVAAPSDTTLFIVKGFDVQGCSATDTVEVFVLSLPVFNLINDTAVCTGGSVTLQANGAQHNTYRWTPLVGLSNSNVDNPIASPAGSTEYFVTVTDVNNCSSVDSVLVDVLPMPRVSTIGDTSTCLHTPITLNTNTSNANTFKWTPSAGLNDANLLNPTASPTISTLYTITAGNGICYEKDSVFVSVLALPDVIANNDTTVCGKANVQLNASGAISYKWNPATRLSNSNVSNPIASPTATTTYVVTGAGTNSCINSDSIIIEMEPAPVFDVTPKNASLCLGDSILLVAQGGDIYNWSPAQTVLNPSSSATKAFPSANTTYKVVITNSVCKVTDSLISNVAVKNLPVITISKSNDIDCLNPQAQLIATGGVNYSWSPSTYISNSQAYNPIVNPPVDSWYSVIAKGENSCSNEDSILVKSTFNPEVAVFNIANAFTPNHDGLNDCFSVKYWGPAEVFDMSIYNRWGQLIYYSKDINSCWDGTLNGMPQPPGTYVYRIIVSSKCSNGLIHKKGTFVLLR